MSATGKLLLLAGVGQQVYGKVALKRFVIGAILIAGLTLVTAILGSAMLIGIFYGSYLALIHHGYTQASAILMLSGLGLIGTLILASIVYSLIRSMRQIPAEVVSGRLRALMPTRAREAVDAFFDGLLAG